ncbi:MAG: DUF3108 domain-containing protein [Gammaproteobacteria bacterium]
MLWLQNAEIFEKGFAYTYALSKNDFTVAHVKRTLSVSLNRIIFSSYAYPVGFASLFISDTINEQSIISIKDNQLRTQSYSFVKKSDEIKEQFHLNFDWNKNNITDSRISSPLRLTSNSFDPLSFQLALAMEVKNHGADLTFDLVDNKHIKTYKLESLGQEQLETDAGNFTTYKFAYFDEIKKRKVIIWCAKQLDYLPVQIKRIDDDGDYGTLKLISLNANAETEKPEDNDDSDF